MRIGNQEITRENMPSFSWAEANPDHTYLSMQDVLKRSRQVMPTKTVGYEDNDDNDMSTKDVRSSQWK